MVLDTVSAPLGRQIVSKKWRGGCVSKLLRFEDVKCVLRTRMQLRSCWERSTDYPKYCHVRNVVAVGYTEELRGTVICDVLHS